MFPFTSLAMGYKLILQNRCNDYNRMIKCCISENVTLLVGVPTVLQNVKTSLINLNINKLDIKRILGGGSSCSLELIKWFWDKYNIEVIQGWGMTECGPSYWARRESRRSDLNLSDHQKLLNNQKCGIPAPAFESKVVDSDNLNKEISHNGKDIGEFLLRGPFVTSKYYNLPKEENNKKFHNGYLITGDIVSISQELLFNFISN